MTPLVDLCRQIVEQADAAGVELDDGNVVDLCVDQLAMRGIAPPLTDIRSALAESGLDSRFPRATLPVFLRQQAD